MYRFSAPEAIRSNLLPFKLPCIIECSRVCIMLFKGSVQIMSDL